MPLDMRYMSEGDRLDNALLGVFYGICVAVIFVAYIVILYVTVGSKPFDRLNVTLVEILGLYLFGGIIGGAIGGYFYHNAETRWGSALVGIITLIPLSIGASLLIPGWESLSQVILEGLLYAVIVGGPAGVIVIRS